MDKSTKKQIFTIIFAIVLVSAFIGAIQLLCNAIEMLNYTTLDTDEYKAVQGPQAIISLVSSIVAFLGVVIGVIVSCKKSKVAKIVCYSSNFAVLFSLVILIVTSNNNWLNYYKDFISKIARPLDTPYFIDSFLIEEYTIHSAVKSTLISQTVYFGIISALYIWDLVKALRKNKSQTDVDESQQLS